MTSEGSKKNDWLRGSNRFCELRTFNTLTLHSTIKRSHDLNIRL